MKMISESVWKEIKKIIPEKETKVGRPHKDYKVIISAILYVMVTGIQWRNIPDYYGCPTTIHGWFRKWIKAGVFDKILAVSIDSAIKQLGKPEAFLVDTSSVKAPFSQFGGKNPTDRAKRGVKKSIVIDWNRVILSILVDAAHIHDSKLLTPHLESIKKYVEKPKVIASDSAWDVETLRKLLADVNLVLHSSTNVRRNSLKRKIKSGGRWKIEQIFGIQQWYRGIKFCWAKTKSSFLAFCQFASAIHNFKLAGIFG